jgi:pimeloyl-ACP methyl ester carboxylesterase
VIRSRGARYAGFGTRELVLDGDGPTIVALHGFGHTGDCWRPVFERLARRGRAAVAVDLPGFGRADDARGGPRLPQLDVFVAAVLAAHAPAVVVGNSLGGLLAVRAAATDPDVVGAMPLCAAGFGWTTAVRLGVIGDLRPLALLAHLPVLSPVRRRLLDVVARTLMYGEPAAADPAMVDLLTAQLTDRHAARRMLRAATTYVAEVATGQRVGVPACPVTVVHGGRDRIVSRAASRRLHDQLPGSTFVVLPRAGHCPHLDAPDDVTGLALALTESTTRRRNST